MIGWLIVGLGLCTLTLIWGTVFTFTVYANELKATFGLSEFQTSFIFSIMTSLFLVAGGLLGILVARLKLRKVVLSTAFGISIAVLLFQIVNSYLGVIIVFGLIGTAGGTAVIVVISLVPQWFDKYQGRAMGVTLTGSGLGILLLPFIWLWLFERTNIRVSFIVVGGVTAGVLFIASIVYRRPFDIKNNDLDLVDLGWVIENITNIRFMTAMVGFALLWTWYFVLSAKLVDILSTLGFSDTLATAAFGFIGGISIFTRVSSGIIADRFGLRTTFIGGVILAGGGLPLLLTSNSRTGLYIALLVFGIGLGAIASLYSPILIQQFGPQNASAIIGTFTLAEACTAFLGPLLINSLFEVTGSYSLPIMGLACITFVGAVLFYWGTDFTPV
ncbi:Predicted arabinose efflux permease, MFS family [Halobellus clavatus]|uniref:Predicted arabinose efflux permease, MFS family n=2 Tax=Halobellus clavatus TaxID=660517 RepID=A0A1H3IW70_9EURY|nr:Predicted arabinose efflux permease, MFS family [Halobellus clavatus]